MAGFSEAQKSESFEVINDWIDQASIVNSKDIVLQRERSQFINNLGIGKLGYEFLIIIRTRKQIQLASSSNISEWEVCQTRFEQSQEILPSKESLCSKTKNY